MTDLLQNFISQARQVYAGLKELRNFRLSLLRKAFSLMGPREKTALLAMLAAAVLALALSGRQAYLSNSVLVPAAGGAYSEGVVGQPAYINPLLAYQDPDLSLTKLVFASLYKYDNQGRLIPDLAEGMPQISEDQKQYTVNLKHGAKWHNGRAVTADDVVFTVRLVKDQAYKSPFFPLWQSTSADKLGDYAVKFSTKDISGPFLHNLTLPILPQFVWNRVEPQNFLLSEANLKAVGSGPYAIREIKKLAGGKISQISLESFPDYFQGRPKIDRLSIKFYDNTEEAYQALGSGEIQGFGALSQDSPADQETWQQDGLASLTLPLPQYQVAFFNIAAKTLGELAVRQALSAAVDRERIIAESKNRGLLPRSPLLPETEAVTAPPDLAAAAKLLDEAGWTVDGNTGKRAKRGQKLEIRLLTNDSPQNSRAAQALAEQWGALQVEVNLKVLPTKELADNVIKPRDFDVLLFAQKFNPDPDPFAFWHSSQVKDPGLNLTGLADPAADKLITQARTTTDQAARKEIYRQFDRLISEKAAVIFLSQSAYIYNVSEKIGNIGLSTIFEPSQRFYDLPNWHAAQDRVWK